MIFFDEAGNSGSNLLDGDQPIYLLLSHDFTKQEVDNILAPLDLASQAKEFHFKNLKKYEKTRRAVLKCINNELISENRVYYYLALKEFMIVIHIVDQLIELVLNDGGIDMYKGGLNLSTANLIYILGNRVWDKVLFKQMCHRFLEWLRSNEDIKGDAFYESVKELYKSMKDEKDQLLVGLILLSEQHRDIVKEAHSKYTLDATLSCFISHCNFWAKKYQVPFDIVFDNSKQIAYWQDMISFLTNRLPSKEVGYGSRKHKYPLLINSMKMVDSLTDRQIQLSDIFASSLNYAYTTMLKGNVDIFSEQILSSQLGSVAKSVMWPSTGVTPEQLDMTDETGTNPLTYLAEHLWNRDKT